MPYFGRTSKKNLETADIRLQRIFNEVIKYFDCSIICGHRDKESQNKVFGEGKSKLQWPHSKHNSYPSKAVDAVPYPINWEDTDRMYMFIGFVKGIATSMGYSIRTGADWDGDTLVDDQSFHDLPHFEILD